MTTRTLIFVFFFTASLALARLAPDRASAADAGDASSNLTYNLERCLTTALEKNFDILQAKERIQKQEGVYIETRAKLFPHASFLTTFDQTDQSRLQRLNGQAFGSEYDWSTNAMLEQSLFSGGQLSAAREREALRRDAARYELESVVNDIVAQVKQRYYLVLLSRAQIKVQEQTVELLEEELASTKHKRDAGTVSDFNVLRAEVELANSKAPLIRAKNAYRIALEELSQIVGLTSHEKGLSGGESFLVIGELTFAPIELDLAQALQTAFAERPELKRLDLLIEADKNGVTVARAGYFPKLSGYVEYGANKSQFSSDFGDENHGWQLGVKGTWSIFDSFETAGRVQQAHSAETTAKLNFEQAKLDIDVEVRRSYSTLVEARELLHASRKVVEQAEESHRLARARLDAGTGIQLEVLDAQVALSNARTNEIRALHDYNSAVAQMIKAMGVSSLEK